jgi:peptidoglycan/LPS O-acetylase OafA/YrhL
MTQHSTGFDLKTAAKLGGIGFLTALVAGIAMLAMAPSGADAEKLGQGIGQLIVFSFFGGVCVSHLEQSGYPLPARFFKGIYVLILIGLVTFAATFEPAATVL